MLRCNNQEPDSAVGSLTTALAVAGHLATADDDKDGGVTSADLAGC